MARPEPRCTQRAGPGDGTERVRVPRPDADPDAGLHEHEREPAPTGGPLIDLCGLRTAANGPLDQALRPSHRQPPGPRVRRRDFDSGVAARRRWHNVELCGTVGSTRRGTCTATVSQIVTAWTDTGTTPDRTYPDRRHAAKTFTLNFDHVVLDQAPGEAGARLITRRPTPGSRPARARRPARSRSIGPRPRTPPPPITYRVYRDGGPDADRLHDGDDVHRPGSDPGSSHTYTVDAIDAVNPTLPSAMSPAVGVDLVSASAPAISRMTSPRGLRQLDFGHAADDRPRDRHDGSPSARAQVSAERLRVPHLGGTLLPGVHEHERERCIGNRHRPVPPSHGRERRRS